jgi:hypothetical protein
VRVGHFSAPADPPVLAHGHEPVPVRTPIQDSCPKFVLGGVEPDERYQVECPIHFVARLRENHAEGIQRPTEYGGEGIPWADLQLDLRPVAVGRVRRVVAHRCVHCGVSAPDECGGEGDHAGDCIELCCAPIKRFGPMRTR